MSPHQPHSVKCPNWAPKASTSGERRMKLNFKFAKHVILTFQGTDEDYVEPFLEPVDPIEDDAPDYHKIIKHPMDLSTMLQKLEDGKYTKIKEVKRSFQRMFANCFKYNPRRNEVYKDGIEFRMAFKKIWSSKDDWIEARATKSSNSSDQDMPDESCGRILYDTSDADEMEDINESDEDTQDDDESSEDDLPPVRRRRQVSYKDWSTGDDTSDDDQTEDSSESEDDTSDDGSPPVKRRRVAFRKLCSTGDDTSKKDEHKWRARKKDGSKRHVVVDEIASDLNANHKSPLNTTAGLETQSSPQDQAVSTEQQSETHNFSSSQQQKVSVDTPARKSRLDTIFQDQFGDQLQVPTQRSQIEQAPAQQPQTEQPVTQQPRSELPQTEPPQIEQPSIQDQQTQQPLQESPPDHPTQQLYRQPLPKENRSNPLQSYLTELITRQMDTTTAYINSNATGEFTEHLVLLSQLCSNERREKLYRMWKVKAMKKVNQMQVQDILVKGVERKVSLALAETVTEQTREFCEQVTRRATAFSGFLGGGDGKISLE